MPANLVHPYTSYLLRVWRVQEQGQTACRATLYAIATGQRWGFDNMSDLLTFLEAQTPEGEESDVKRET
jgi:hypothetical protein